MQHWGNGFFAMNDGVERPLLYAAAAVALALTGPGAYSLDAGLGLHELSRATVAVALTVAILGAVATLALRRPAPATR